MPPPDPKADPRVRDPDLLRELHGRWRMCALCGSSESLSLHHIIKRPRDDVEANLIMLCGDGVRGCHGKVEAHDALTLQALAIHILRGRPDTVDHLVYRLGSGDAMQAWFVRQMGD